MASTEPTVQFLTNDDQKREVVWDVYRQFGLFSPQDGRSSFEPELRPREAIPLPNVSSSVLDKVIEYCERHRNDPLLCTQSEEYDDPRRRHVDEIGEWDQNFIQVDHETLFEIILAANYLDIKPLLDVGCKTVANMIKNKNPEEIRKLFNIVNNFTPEEEAQIKKENEWSEDREVH